MAELTSTTIVPIGLYCFMLAGYFMSLVVNAILGNIANLSDADISFWFPVGGAAVLSVGLAIIGRGFLQMKSTYWKILFFSLAISVSLTTSMILAYLILLW